MATNGETINLVYNSLFIWMKHVVLVLYTFWYMNYILVIQMQVLLHKPIDPHIRKSVSKIHGSVVSLTWLHRINIEVNASPGRFFIFCLFPSLLEGFHLRGYLIESIHHCARAGVPMMLSIIFPGKRVI